MKAKDKKSLAVGIVFSFMLCAIGTILVFCLTYYLFPSHPWMINGVINEAARRLAFEDAIKGAFVVGAIFAVAGLLVVLARALWLAFGRGEQDERIGNC